MQQIDRDVADIAAALANLLYYPPDYLDVLCYHWKGAGFLMQRREIASASLAYPFCVYEGVAVLAANVIEIARMNNGTGGRGTEASFCRHRTKLLDNCDVAHVVGYRVPDTKRKGGRIGEKRPHGFLADVPVVRHDPESVKLRWGREARPLRFMNPRIGIEARHRAVLKIWKGSDFMARTPTAFAGIQPLVFDESVFDGLFDGVDGPLPESACRAIFHVFVPPEIVAALAAKYVSVIRQRAGKIDDSAVSLSAQIDVHRGQNDHVV